MYFSLKQQSKNIGNDFRYFFFAPKRRPFFNPDTKTVAFNADFV
jgi:hypothetical protein